MMSNLKRVTVRIPEKLALKIETLANEMNISNNDTYIVALTLFIKTIDSKNT